MRRHIRYSKGQVTVEVAILFGVVVAALVALAIYIQRAVQGGLKGNADSFGSQFSSTEAWDSHSRSANREEGALIRSAQFTKACQGVGGEKNPGCTPPDPDATKGQFALPEPPCPDGSTTLPGKSC